MSRKTVWCLEVTPHLDEKLERYIKLDSYKTKSEFIRAAVRDRLEQETRTLQEKPEQQ